MERVDYDPEIDPSIREEREAAERDRELSARIRLEIERYVADNDLVPRVQSSESELPPPWESGPAGSGSGSAPESESAMTKEERRAQKQRENEARREEKRTRRQAGAATRRKAVQSVVSGSILSSDWVRRMWPYLLAIAAVLVLYIGYTFHIQMLHLERQVLEREVRELGIEAVERTAERVRETRRSAIVERLARKGIPLEEFPHPVKTIER
ncbi:MAG: hypothetical protein LBV38_00450 [Alistipes sp.]|jgi:hypothetical protein|nr:hypothetical protein [Alistipes sp.]